MILLALWQAALRRNRTLIKQLQVPTEMAPATPVQRGIDTPGGLFSLVGDRVHEVVLLHAGSILYANPQFAELLGLDRKELVGRSLAEFVPPDQAELVAGNLTRSLAGQDTPMRFEVDLQGAQGQTARLEIGLTNAEYEGAPALLITGVEVIPTHDLTGPCRRHRDIRTRGSFACAAGARSSGRSAAHHGRRRPHRLRQSGGDGSAWRRCQGAGG